MTRHTIVINKRKGTIEWLAPPPFKLLVMDITRRRYSEIVPLDPILCLWFRLLRFTFGEEGNVAAWTRRWLCIWRGVILLGPHRGSEFISPFRQAVLDWEKEKFSEPKFPL